VDNSASTVALGQEILTGARNAIMIKADLGNPSEVRQHPQSQSFLDYTRPIAVLMIGVLDYIPDSRSVEQLVAEYGASSSAATYLALTHITVDEAPAHLAEQVAQLAKRHRELVGVPLVPRQRITLNYWLGDRILMCPGVTHPGQWQRPLEQSADPNPVEESAICAVGHDTSNT
jgi:hypothetical protein